MPVEVDKDGEFEKEGRRMSEVGAVSSTKGGLREKPLDDGNVKTTQNLTPAASRRRKITIYRIKYTTKTHRRLIYSAHKKKKKEKKCSLIVQGFEILANCYRLCDLPY